MKKASFKKRALAYIIDIFIVSIIISIISYNFDTTKVDKLNNEAYDLVKDYVKGDISTEKYLKDYASINYDISRESVVNTSLYLIVCVGYFLIFQYLNDGASIGKKIIGIKIVSDDKKNVSFLQMFIRTSIINDIISSAMVIILVYMTSNMNYFIGYGIINFGCNLFIIACILMIIFRKDRLALNDLMSKSYVVETR